MVGDVASPVNLFTQSFLLETEGGAIEQLQLALSSSSVVLWESTGEHHAAFTCYDCDVAASHCTL